MGFRFRVSGIGLGGVSTNCGNALFLRAVQVPFHGLPISAEVKVRVGVRFGQEFGFGLKFQFRPSIDLLNTKAKFAEVAKNGSGMAISGSAHFSGAFA